MQEDVDSDVYLDGDSDIEMSPIVQKRKQKVSAHLLDIVSLVTTAW